MATRLYYVANTAPPISPAFDAGWNSTTGAVRRMAAVTQDAATEQSTVNIGATGPSYTCQVQLVSPPLTAQTITGAVTVISRGRENTANANVNKRARSVRVVSGDGLTVRGTLNAWAATTSTTELSANTLQGQQHALNASLTSVTCQDGDRLVIEIGYGVGTSGTSPQGLMEWGGTGTDHGTGNSDVTGSVPWVEFSADLTFQASGATVQGAAVADLGFSGSATGVREALGSAGASLGFAASAAGTRSVAGAAAVSLPLTAAAVGTVTAGGAQVPGVGSALLGFGATASAVRVVAGQASALWGLTAGAVGAVEVPGLAGAVFDFAAVAAGVVSTPGAVVVRPDSGVASRPGSGVVARPFTGVVPRATSVVVRPDAGVVVRP